MNEEIPLGPPKQAGQPDEPAPVKAAAKTTRKIKEPKDSKAPKEPKVEPQLQVYFGKTTLSASAFVKAVAEVKALKFSEDDIAEAERLRLAGDRDHKRLLALAVQPALPPQIDTWLWPTILGIIRTNAPSAFEPFNIEADASFRRLHRELSSALDSDVIEARQPAQVVLQLGLIWMATKRSLDLATTLHTLGDTFATGEKAIGRSVRQALVSGRIADIQRAVAVSKLVGKAAREVAQQRDAEKVLRAAVEERLDGAREEIAELRRTLASLQSEVSDLKERLQASQTELDDSRQHWGHDMVEVKTRQASLLKEKIVPMLGDAVDALEIEPAAPNIALRRIRSVLSSIKETDV
ncbi:hypothetical protein [Methylobacterium sp. E-016]|uniref:hypothetical protein n=1 Tax=Methylobacterium sp. E-016 TaxID=2836556 RepID=UPI001FBA5CE5|nr:hypothetical protein [Methylobacterium sp. E-016]